MTLYVDVGNTALKWRYRQGCRTKEGGTIHGRRWEEALQEAFAGPVAPDAVWIASVAGAEADQRIAELVRRKTGKSPFFYYSLSRDFGVENCYPDPRRLGVDRWVAMIECYQRWGAGIIIDCGSALTIDAVDEKGRFLGGYIVPGLDMLTNALLRDTADVHMERGKAEQGLGQSTGACVHNGLLRMSVAFVSDVVADLSGRLPAASVVLVTGGNSARLLPFFPFPCRHLPDLVLTGLERVATGRVPHHDA